MNTITADKNDFHSAGYYDRCTALTVHWCVCMMGKSCRTKCCRTDCVEGLMWPVMNVLCFSKNFVFSCFQAIIMTLYYVVGFHYITGIVVTTNNDLQSKQQLTKSNKETLEKIF